MGKWDKFKKSLNNYYWHTPTKCIQYTEYLYQDYFRDNDGSRVAANIALSAPTSEEAWSLKYRKLQENDIVVTPIKDVITSVRYSKEWNGRDSDELCNTTTRANEVSVVKYELKVQQGSKTVFIPVERNTISLSFVFDNEGFHHLTDGVVEIQPIHFNQEVEEEWSNKIKNKL